jgi:hypothetical protein
LTPGQLPNGPLFGNRTPETLSLPSLLAEAPLLLLSVEDFAKHQIQFIERAAAVTCKARAMHDGERFGI